MQGRDFAVIAAKLRSRRPKKEEAISMWLQYEADVQAMADALRELSPPGEFRKQQFIYECITKH